MHPTGQNVDIEFGHYRATVTEVGGGLRELTHRRRNLVVPFPAESARPLYRGAVLAPWPNRIGDGRYAFAGQEHQLALSEPELGNAVHGLVAWAAWEITDRAADRVTMRHILWPQPGYPFLLELTVSYVLTEGGLSWRLSATNRGESPAPYGCSIHPYLCAGPGRVGDWSFELPATSYLESDDRWLPHEMWQVADTDFDYRSLRKIGATRLNHAFGGINLDGSGQAAARLVGADGVGVGVSWGRDCSWVQLYTADNADPTIDRLGLAVEPMTCPPDAFRTGVDRITLEPGETTTSQWQLFTVGR